MKISYAITVCNELEEIQKLLKVLFNTKREEDEIVILLDKKNTTEETEQYLDNFHQLSKTSGYNYPTNIILYKNKFNNHFGDWKNLLKNACKGDYIFQIDADEIPNTYLIENLPEILESNPDNDVYLVPRVNTVEGLTQEHIDKWKWNVNEGGWINFPDYQWRIWKNKPNIKWQSKVHESLTGYKAYAFLPGDENYALFHNKKIDKQEKQNNYYEQLSIKPLH